VAGNIPFKNKNILLIAYITDSVSTLFSKYEITHSDFPSVHTNPTMFRQTLKRLTKAFIYSYKLEAKTIIYYKNSSR
jgi:hypothetical protein